MYVASSILLFSLSKFSSVYDKVFRIYMLPYLLPTAHIGLMGSIYCTLALTIERYIAVCHPFLPHRQEKIFFYETFLSMKSMLNNVKELTFKVCQSMRNCAEMWENVQKSLKNYSKVTKVWNWMAIIFVFKLQNLIWITFYIGSKIKRFSVWLLWNENVLNET